MWSSALVITVPFSPAAPPADGEDLPDPLARHQARQRQEEREGSGGGREEEEGGRGQAGEGGEEGQAQRVSER